MSITHPNSRFPVKEYPNSRSQRYTNMPLDFVVVGFYARTRMTLTAIAVCGRAGLNARPRRSER